METAIAMNIYEYGNPLEICYEYENNDMAMEIIYIYTYPLESK